MVYSPLHFCPLNPPLSSYQLKVAEACGFMPRDLSPIYTSVAETLSDCGRFSQALHYYNKELKLWRGNPSQVSLPLFIAKHCPHCLTYVSLVPSPPYCIPHLAPSLPSPPPGVLLLVCHSPGEGEGWRECRGCHRGVQQSCSSG